MAFARPFLNGFTALGIPVTETVGWVCPGKREVRPSTDLCNRVVATATCAGDLIHWIKS